MESTLGSLALRESFERRFRTNHTLFSAHLQEDGALEFKEDRHAQNVHTVKNLAFVVCRAKGRLRLAVLLGSGLVRSFGVLVFRNHCAQGSDPERPCWGCSAARAVRNLRQCSAVMKALTLVVCAYMAV